MRFSRVLWIGLTIIVGVAVVIVVTALLTPQQTNPAYARAVEFAQAVGKGDEAAAFALLDATMQTYARAHCPDGKITACVASYIPADWGGFESAVFRRAAPGARNPTGLVSAYDVEVLATYEQGKGGSGVCIYERMEPTGSDWRVAGYAGFISCGDPASRNMQTNADTPNRAP